MLVHYNSIPFIHIFFFNRNDLWIDYFEERKEQKWVNPASLEDKNHSVCLADP